MSGRARPADGSHETDTHLGLTLDLFPLHEESHDSW